MKNQKLNYIFNNPNTADAVANHLLKIFIEANADRVDKLIRAAANKKSRSK